MKTISPDPTKKIELALPLTPLAITNLHAAVEESRQAGTGKAVGAESIFLAIVRDKDSIPAQILSSFSLRDDVIAGVEGVMASEGFRKGSNQVVNAKGKRIGFMWKDDNGDPFVGDAHGNPIEVTERMARGE